MSQEPSVWSPLEIRAAIGELLEDILGPPDEGRAWAVSDHHHLAFDYGLESIEVIALIDRLGSRFGWRMIGTPNDGQDLSALIDRLSVGWVVEQVMASDSLHPARDEART